MAARTGEQLVERRRGTGTTFCTPPHTCMPPICVLWYCVFSKYVCIKWHLRHFGWGGSSSLSHKLTSILSSYQTLSTQFTLEFFYLLFFIHFPLRQAGRQAGRWREEGTGGGGGGGREVGTPHTHICMAAAGGLVWLGGRGKEKNLSVTISPVFPHFFH